MHFHGLPVFNRFIVDFDRSDERKVLNGVGSDGNIVVFIGVVYSHDNVVVGRDIREIIASVTVLLFFSVDFHRVKLLSVGGMPDADRCLGSVHFDFSRFVVNELGHVDVFIVDRDAYLRRVADDCNQECRSLEF